METVSVDKLSKNKSMSGRNRGQKIIDHWMQNSRNETLSSSEIISSLDEFFRMGDLLYEMSSIAKIGVWELDAITNKLKWSTVVYDIHEIERGQNLVVEEAIDFYIPEHREIIENAVKESIESAVPYDLELKIVTGKSNEKWVRTIGKPIFIDGQLAKIQGLFQDIDDYKSAADNLKKVNKELESFSYSVSHDLRAPLRSINGFAEALYSANQSQLNDSSLQYLERILANSKRMETLIDDLLEFSRFSKKTVQFVSVDTNSVLAEIVNNYFIDHKSIINCEPLPNIVGDQDMLEQVFTNILSNAIKYSSKEVKPQIRISGEETTNHILISFTDNGTGFDMKYAHKLFKVFQRLHLDSDFEGTGVGLAICNKIMNKHDGEIIPNGALGKGSTFTLKFRKIPTN